ncbi:MAG: hypothetical protein HY092_01675 [Candidatus Kerfeldbacteria bacterium]|nr:hypothetical protein [Candidatus Kerfeldbacteria bacterium]
MNTKSGQSLLETIIAIGVIMSATIAATSLIVSTITAGQASQEKIEAANFAREGIEVIRGIRDSNWLKIDHNQLDSSGSSYLWNTGLGSGTDNIVFQYVLVFQPVGVGWQAKKISGPTPPSNETSDSYIYLPASGQYFTQATATVPCAGCQRTRYTRVISVTKKTESLFSGTTSVQYIDLTSTVTWTDQLGLHHLDASARLYNWK